MTLQESAEEVVYFHECTALEGRRIRTEAIKAGLMPKGATLAEAFFRRIESALRGIKSGEGLTRRHHQHHGRILHGVRPFSWLARYYQNHLA